MTATKEAKKKPAAKSAGKKAAETKAKKAAAAAAPKGKEIDVEKVDVARARKMLGATHRLAKKVERTAAALAVASKARRAAKASHEAAIEELERELRDQRYGPGPLYNKDGSGAAGTPEGQKDASTS